jgi:hypothetical protein
MAFGAVSQHQFLTSGSLTWMRRRTNCGHDPGKILSKDEKEKQGKYLEQHFTPLVFSVDGMRGAEAQAVSKPLALLLSTKWNRTYSDVYVVLFAPASQWLSRDPPCSA